jgi:hypothetical protein
VDKRLTTSVATEETQFSEPFMFNDEPTDASDGAGLSGELLRNDEGLVFGRVATGSAVTEADMPAFGVVHNDVAVPPRPPR